MTEPGIARASKNRRALAVPGISVQRERSARLHEMRARGQYRKATLIERYGPDQNMVDLRLILAAGCPKIEAGRVMDLCGVYYPDRIGK